MCAKLLKNFNFAQFSVEKTSHNKYYHGKFLFHIFWRLNVEEFNTVGT